MVTTNSVSKEITEARSTMADRIVQEVGRAHGCELDALVLSLPGCDWHDVALEVHRLSRAGQLQVSACGGGIYTVRAPAEAGKRGGGGHS